MYNKLSKKKWKFNLGGKPPIQGIDPTMFPDVTPEDIAKINALFQANTQQNNATSNNGLNLNNIFEDFTEGEGSEETQEGEGTEEDGDAADSKSKFGIQDYVQGGIAGISSLQKAKLNDGKITNDEIVGSGLDTAAGMAGPYGQIANSAITIGENLLGDELYQGLGEGVEYEKGASRAGKGALKGAAFGAKVAGPWGAVAGLAVGGAAGLFGQEKRKKEALKEFEKRRDERIRNMNQQSKTIYADQYQTFYKKGGKAIIKIKKQNKNKFTSFCLKQGYTGVTQECIDKAKKSNSSSLKKQAVFAENAQSWNK